MTAILPDIGNTLKTLRGARGWSLTLAAEKTGVSKAMLGQIERRESSPTVATLWKIATGFNVPFSLFLSARAAAGSAAVQRSAPLPVNADAQAGMQATPLFPFDAALGFDLLHVTLPGGAYSESSAHDTGVTEHVVVLSGTLELTVQDTTHRLNAGEGLRFAADCVHVYRNPLADTCQFHSLIHYP